MEIWIWLGIIILLVFIEAETTALVSVWFIISGIVSLILSLFNVDFVICFGVFVILGTILLLTTRKSLEKYFKFTKTKTNIDKIVGQKGIVTKDIKKDTIGEVKVEGKVWSAYSKDDLEVGTNVKILKIDSVKLCVCKWEDDK